ncbi:SDR family oxidoreductase [Caulobacter segnis]
MAIAYLNEDRDAEATRLAVELEGRRAILLPGDVADPAYAKAAVEKTVAELGRLDILVNNAAFQEHVLDFENLTEEHFDRTLRTNLYGYFHMAKAAVKHRPTAARSSAYRFGDRPPGQQGPAGLLDDQGRHPRLPRGRWRRT